MDISNINGTIVINGRKFSGKSVSITNGKIVIDGKPVDSDISEKEINVTIEGNCENVENGSGYITVKGDVLGFVRAGSGNINCGDVKGSVSTGSGDVKCGKVEGGVSTGSGDIKRSIW